MNDIAIDTLLNKTGSLYKLVVMASRRTIELADGAARLVDMPKDTTPSDVALEEIAEGRISLKAEDEK